MCGRYLLLQQSPALQNRFQAESEAEWSPSYNVGPRRRVPVVTQESECREIRFMRMGWTPPWLNRVLINVRSETVFEKKLFKEAIQFRRCLVPAEGFYEWKPMKRYRQPYLVLPKQLISFAGIWFQEESGEEAFSILTAPAMEPLASIHSRAPVILAPEDETTWLSQSPIPDTLNQMIDHGRKISYELRPVRTWINSPRAEGPRCLERTIHEPFEEEQGDLFRMGRELENRP